MVKSLLLVVMLLISSWTTHAQLSNEYQEWIKKANAFYDAKQYQQSADAFSQAFASNGWKGRPDDRYNAACAWALAGNADSAFFQLNRIATKSNFTDLPHLLEDDDLAGLRSDKRWDELCTLVKQNKDNAEKNLDRSLVAMLDTIFQDDQGDRLQEEKLVKKYGNNSDEVKAIWKTISMNDSIDLIKTEKIIDKYGWSGPDVAGQQGSQTIFLVIQHADIKVQEKYLPMMREAVKNGKASASSLALLEDRVALREGRKQIYGSQITIDERGNYCVDILDDPDNVDKRRAEVGLGPLAQYVRYWNIKWDPEAYKKLHPELERRENIK